MTRLPNTLVLGAVLAMAAAGCGKGGGAGGAPPIASKDGAEGLTAFFTAAADACNAKDFAKGKSLILSLLPSTKDELAQALKPDAPADFADKVVEQYKKLPPGDDKQACLLTPGNGRTEVKVYASTTEDIIAYKQGTPAFEEFPGGAKTVAEKALKPGMTFYEVEVTEPGKDSGTKFHLFYWNGTQWKMMGAAWRALGDQ